MSNIADAPTIRNPNPDGLAARRAAAIALSRILEKGVTLEAALEEATSGIIESNDRGFAQILTRTCLRRLGQIDGLLNTLLERPLPAPASYAKHALRIGLTQLLWLDTPAHAAVFTTVELVKPSLPKFAGLVNAIMQRGAREGKQLLTTLPDSLNVPEWLFNGWQQQYGQDVAAQIASVHLQEPPLDITVKCNPTEWAEKLNGEVLFGNTIRIQGAGNITKLEGYEEGAWWVQDISATLPAQMLGDVAGKEILDMCAAPGGKTMQLANAGAKVTALDISANRLKLLAQNLQRCQLQAKPVCFDATKWKPPQLFDAILLDAPCSATGTIRRHPDIAYHRTREDIAKLAQTQARLLQVATGWLKPGGVLVYATCSLEAAEGEDAVRGLLNARQDIKVENLVAPLPDMLQNEYGMRTLPTLLADKGGMDGFFMTRLIKQ